MSSVRAYRFQLRLKPAQQRQLQRTAGGLRWVWNQALAEQRARHARGERYASYADMCKWLTAWRGAPDTAWLAHGPVHPQQQVLKRQLTAEEEQVRVRQVADVIVRRQQEDETFEELTLVNLCAARSY